MQRRMGKRKWKKLLRQLQKQVRKAKKVDGLSTPEYRSKIEELGKYLQSFLNVIEHRGKKGPPRWVREK